MEKTIALIEESIKDYRDKRERNLQKPTKGDNVAGAIITARNIEILGFISRLEEILKSLQDENKLA